MRRQRSNNFFILICGPTGSGKTDLSYLLAREFPIEIINCDVGQFYEPLSIGTAKPPWQDSSVPHHLFDCLAEPRDFTVLEYRKRMQALMDEIWRRGAFPVVVGGSLFYAKSLFFPPEETAPLGVEESEESPVTNTSTGLSNEQLWQELFAIDPERAIKIDQHDRYRTQRALDLWRTTGQLPSSRKPKFQPLADFHIFCTVRDREELYQRINSRVMLMLQEGWVREADSLPLLWKAFLMRKKILGYPEIISCLEDHTVAGCSVNSALIEVLQRKTRNYAKRQMTFWRSFKKNIEEAAGRVVTSEVNLTLSSVDLYLNHMRDVINNQIEETV